MDTKICSICNQLKKTSEYHYKKSEARYNSCCKYCVYELQKNRWKDRKIKAVDLMGGSCSVCGYNRNYAAFHFHHLNSDDKEFDWNKLRLQKWGRIVEELKKCILLCGNCHMELHYPEMSVSDNYIPVHANAYLNKEIKTTGVCPYCECKVYGTKYCSTECAGKANRKAIRPTKQELLDLIEKTTWKEIGRTFNVSDNAVRKWAKQYNLI